MGPSWGGVLLLHAPAAAPRGLRRGGRGGAARRPNAKHCHFAAGVAGQPLWFLS